MVHVNALFTPLVTQTIVTIACISVLPGACQSSHPLRPAAFVHAPSHREHASSGAFDAWFRKRRIAERQCARLPVFREHGCVLEARQSRSAQIPGQLSRGAPHDSENVINHATGYTFPSPPHPRVHLVKFHQGSFDADSLEHCRNSNISALAAGVHRVHLGQPRAQCNSESLGEFFMSATSLGQMSLQRCSEKQPR
jgi:hypothetical protein